MELVFERIDFADKPRAQAFGELSNEARWARYLPA
jgi:hypothetical protein